VEDFGLTLAADIAVAREGREHLLVTQIWGPRLVLFRRFAKLPAKWGECLAKAGALA